MEDPSTSETIKDNNPTFDYFLQAREQLIKQRAEFESLGKNVELLDKQLAEYDFFATSTDTPEYYKELDKLYNVNIPKVSITNSSGDTTEVSRYLINTATSNRGAFGEFFCVFDTKTHQIKGIKVEPNEDIQERAIVHANLEQYNIAKVYDYMETVDHATSLTVMKYYSPKHYTDIYNACDSNYRSILEYYGSETVVLDTVAQLSNALMHMERKGYYHGDLSFNNLLIPRKEVWDDPNHSEQAVILDFGFVSEKYEKQHYYGDTNDLTRIAYYMLTGDYLTGYMTDSEFEKLSKREQRDKISEGLSKSLSKKYPQEVISRLTNTFVRRFDPLDKRYHSPEEFSQVLTSCFQ